MAPCVLATSPCPDISSSIFVPRPGWYPIVSNYTVGRACDLLNQHGSRYSAAEKNARVEWTPFVSTWNTFHILVSPFNFRDAVKRFFRSSAFFRHLSFQKCSEREVFCALWLPHVLRATMVCNFSSLIWPDGSAPAALASLLFDPSGATNHWKNTVFRDFPTFSRIWASFFWPFLFSDLLSAALLFSDSSHLCFSICPYCRKFDF